MKIQGVIFDFNGVLLWDTPLHDAAWRACSAHLRGVPFSERELTEKVHGRTNRIILEYLLNRPLNDAEADQIAQEKEEHYRRMCLENRAEFTLSPGAVPLLEMLSQNKIPHAIATSSEKHNVAFYLQHLELLRWFPPAHIIYDDGTLAGKPAPDIYLRAAKALDLPPQSCLVIEDSRSGIQAAQAAGIGHITALGPAERHAELAELPGVTRVITTLAEIPALLKA